MCLAFNGSAYTPRGYHIKKECVVIRGVRIRMIFLMNMRNIMHGGYMESKVKGRREMRDEILWGDGTDNSVFYKSFMSWSEEIVKGYDNLSSKMYNPEGNDSEKKDILDEELFKI